MPAGRLKGKEYFLSGATISDVEYGTLYTNSSGAFYLRSALPHDLDLGAPPFDPPSKDKMITLLQEQIEQYQRDGHIVLRNVCNQEDIAQYRSTILAAVERFNPVMMRRDTYGKAFLQICRLQEVDEGVRRFVFAKCFAQIAGTLMRVNAVRLYHDQALFKEPGGGHTPWHQDQFYWPLDTDNTITMWMPLVDVSQKMGTMHFASESHRDGFAGHFEISDASEDAYTALIKERGYKLSSCGDMKAGDASFHSGLVLHGAPGNSTERRREAMTVIYYEDGTRLMKPDNPNRANVLKHDFCGLKPGEIAATPKNPVLWRKHK